MKSTIVLKESYSLKCDFNNEKIAMTKVDSYYKLFWQQQSFFLKNKVKYSYLFARTFK